MTMKFGGCVYDQSGKVYDWGQALARECYGEDWEKMVPEEPTRQDINRAREWELDQIPTWVDIHRLQGER